MRLQSDMFLTGIHFAASITFLIYYSDDFC